MQHARYTNNYWGYVAWYVNKQLLEECSLICKQTLNGDMQGDT